MSKALDYYDAGFRDLISVIPPDGKVSENSKISQKDAGKSPGRKNYQGLYVGYPWMTYHPDRGEVQKWVMEGSSIGFGAWSYPAIDIDVMDAAAADAVVAAVEARVGPCVKRVGQAPKAVLIFQCAAPLRSFDVRYTKHHELLGDEHQLVQFLGTGRQYVMDGIHPVTGYPYSITDPLGALTLLGPEGLPMLTLELLIELFDIIAKVMTGHGYEAGTDASVRAQAGEVNQNDLKAPTMDMLGGVVADLPNNTPDRHEYIAVGYAIKAASQDDPAGGLDVFKEWCSRWEGGANEDEQIETDWAKMVPPYRTGYDWLLKRGADWGVNMSQWTFGAAEQPGKGPSLEEFSDLLGEIPEEPEAADEASWDPIWHDVGLSDEFTKANKERFTLVPDLDDAVFEWDGKHWVRGNKNALTTALSRFLSRKAGNAHYLIEDAKQRAIVVDSLNSYRKMKNVLSQLRTTSRLIKFASDITDDPDLLNTPAGTYDLPSGRMVPHDPKNFSTQCTSVAPDPNAYCPRWRLFLEEATGGDKDLEIYLQKLAGYALTGHVHSQVFPFFIGSGGNGKSVFVSALQRVLGSYSESMPVELLQQRKQGGGGNVEYYMAKLKGVRLVVTSETKTGGYWDDQRVKQLTGEDTVTARLPYGQPFDFHMQGTLLVFGNYAPELAAVGEAMARRIHIVPWLTKPQKPDPLLSQKLKKEDGGILSWAIEGAQMWYAQGLDKPTCIRDETDDYLTEQDIMGRWVNQCLIVTRPGPDAPCVSSKELYMSYSQYQTQNYGQPVGFYKFGQLVSPILRTMGARKTRSSGERGWRMLRIRDSEVLPANVAKFPGKGEMPVEPPPAPGYNDDSE